MSKIERRFITASLRMADSAAGVIQGTAAVHYDGTKRTQSQNLGGFVERLKQGCFDKCLAANPDVRILFNHDPNVVLGRTSAGTAKVWSDLNGLQFRCNLPDTRTGEELWQSIDRGDISQCSFGFVPGDDPGDQDWDDPDYDLDPDDDAYGCQIRTINRVDQLLDCSPVSFPAYNATSVSARDLWPNGQPEAVLRALQHRDNEAQLSFARSQRRNLINRVIGQ